MDPEETEMDKDILDDGCDFIKANELPGKKFEKRYESKNYIDLLQIKNAKDPKTDF